MAGSTPRVGRRANRCALAFALLFPSLVTWTYFVALADQAETVQQSAYSIGKFIQFGFPLVWVLTVQRATLRWRRPAGGGLVEGLAFGLAASGAIILLYHGWLKPAGFFEGPDEAVRERVQGLGVDTLWRFAALGAFYSLCHSFLEEYYWRWFVFGQLRAQTGLGAAMAVSSLGFMAHHVLVLATFFGWQSPATYLFSLAVAAGGAVWAWMYERSGSIYGPWLSHLIIDAAIFLIGYDIVKDVLV